MICCPSLYHAYRSCSLLETPEDKCPLWGWLRPGERSEVLRSHRETSPTIPRNVISTQRVSYLRFGRSGSTRMLLPGGAGARSRREPDGTALPAACVPAHASRALAGSVAPCRALHLPALGSSRCGPRGAAGEGAEEPLEPAAQTPPPRWGPGWDFPRRSCRLSGGAGCLLYS